MQPQAEIPNAGPLEAKLASARSPEVIAPPAALAIPRPSVCVGSRPSVGGKFLWVGDEKLFVRGVTYGPFRPDPDGNPYPAPAVVERDFSRMSASGLNCVRTYDVPPRWLMDLAQKEGLRLMVGLEVEHFGSFLDDRKVTQEIRKGVAAKVRACAGHPAILCYALANEITASNVRWHGARRVERFLEEVYAIAKAEDPEGLVTYINYPSTEYLDLPFLDLVCFNVYLESQPQFAAYLARLQNTAGERPLLMTEMGLDSRRNGVGRQAESLKWQIQTAFEAGCAGAIVFKWTDEWYAGGRDVEDWDFGLTDRQRKGKPSLNAVCEAFADCPFPSSLPWPRISVVVCIYNGQRTIRECLESLLKLRYPNYEVIVVNDGSKDKTPAILREYDVCRISTENRGLSAARNIGLQAATGEIVAYVDDDACPDPDWLLYLAAAFRNSDYAAIGGPNIPFPDDGFVANCITLAPGRPTHVLLSDTEAEHIPGCNMAFRKARLEAVGGFDTQFRVAGDDVDACWRIQKAGGRLGFSPAAMVWHHTRNSVRTFWKQQKGYGKAEAMLERKWPEKYDSLGNIGWQGRIYSDGIFRTLERRRGRVYQGTWGTAGFARLYTPPAGLLASLPLMPEWYLICLMLSVLGAMGLAWRPLLVALPLLAAAVGLPIARVAANALRSSRPGVRQSRSTRFKKRMLIVALHVLQPIARLWGRLSNGLTPWRRRMRPAMLVLRKRTYWMWTNTWRDPISRLEEFESALRAQGAVVRRGGDFDHWDLEVMGGIFGAGRILMAQGFDSGKHLVRVRAWTRFCYPTLFLACGLAALSGVAGLEGAWSVATVLGATALAVGALLWVTCAGVVATITSSVEQLGFKE